MANDKRKEVSNQLDEMLKEVRVELEKLTNKAFAAGGLSDAQKELNSYVLSKDLISIYFAQNPYPAYNDRAKKDRENLSKII